MYCYGLEEQFKNHTDIAEAVSGWELAMRHANSVGTNRITDTEKLAIDYLKDVLSAGGIFSLPNQLLTHCLGDLCPVEDQTAMPQYGDIVRDTLRLVDAQRHVALDDAAVGALVAAEQAVVDAEQGAAPAHAPKVSSEYVEGWTFMRATHAFPERRVLAHALHVRLSKHCIHVLATHGEHASILESDAGRVMFCMDYATPKALDLHRLFVRTPPAEVFRVMVCWKGGVGAHLRPQRALGGGAELGRMLPLGSIEDGGGMQEDNDEATALALQGLAHDAAPMAIAESFFIQGAVVGSDRTVNYFDHLSKFGLDRWASALELDMFREGENEFGEVQYQLDLKSVRWQGVWGVTDPRSVYMCPSSRDWKVCSKVNKH